MYLLKERNAKFWKINIFGPTIKQIILKHSQNCYKKIYFVWISYFAVIVIFLPIWGGLRDFFLYVQVYEIYFGRWAIVPKFIYSSTLPFMAYSAIRLPAAMLYVIYQLHLQLILINQKLLRISNNESDPKYQDRITRILYNCIHHHVILKK